MTPHQGPSTMDVIIKNAAVVVDGQVSKDGRIFGLKKYAGHTVKVVVMEEKKDKP